MKSKLPFYVLSSPFFLLCLVILLANDFYLKCEFHNFITGKLSDFVGLFIFPIFISVFLPKRIEIVFILTGIFFIFWKSELSEDFILMLCNITNLSFHRTIDYTDLMALSILPLSYYYLKNLLQRNYELKKGYSFALSFICLFSFYATSVAHKEISINLKSNKTYQLPLSKKQLFKMLNNGSGNNANSRKNMNDSIYIVQFNIPTLNSLANARVKIKQVNHFKVDIQLDSILSCTFQGKFKKSDLNACRKIKLKEFEYLFRKNYIDIIKSRKFEKTNLYYFNVESK